MSEQKRWHWCSDRLPEKAGEYYVVRRAMGGRPHYNDWCGYEPGENGQPGRWKNRRGTVISTVESWREDAPEEDAEEK